jgi:hypothetical protein
VYVYKGRRGGGENEDDEENSTSRPADNRPVATVLCMYVCMYIHT